MRIRGLSSECVCVHAALAFYSKMSEKELKSSLGMKKYKSKKTTHKSLIESLSNRAIVWSEIEEAAYACQLRCTLSAASHLLDITTNLRSVGGADRDNIVANI